MRMVNLHTFTLVQTFFSKLKIEWIIFEILTSSKVMPVLRRANVSFFININDLIHIGSSSLFTDRRYVDVHFAFHLINCPEYIKMTQYIPTDNLFRRREITRGYQYYHHMWYTLPWAFDEFFHEYLPERWITQVEVFQIPFQKMVTIDQSSFRTLDASETLHLSYYNGPISIHFSTLRNITLVNNINCLQYCSLWPKTISSIRILFFYFYPNYIIPNWPVILNSLSSLTQLNSLHVFMYDLPKTVDDKNCQIIAEIASQFADFGFYFRRKHSGSRDFDIDSVFKEHIKFIKQLYQLILPLCLDKQSYYSIEEDSCGLTIWF
ncbi:unnamed protein product [Rotaria sordida]|uniref:Uncharacterized protein n=1 Tax=Rotaria sordida TaxID=392033 RepID=A0A815RKB8_9BILA|nr:unnamed protein product [Rotaria sordida]CAF3666418.1 unnamed protein product [Rotaria sordida]CAF3733862.1 unnamed protein product [Rotaria sordida]